MGFTGEPPTRTSQWQWGPVLLPVEPSLAICWPWAVSYTHLEAILWHCRTRWPVLQGTESCYYQRDRYLVDFSSVCLCYQYKNTGGTAYTVSYAREKGRKIIPI